MTDANPVLSKDALIFGFGYLNNPKAKLAFGGEGATRRITERARAALDELLAAGYAEPAEPTTSIPGREYYRGVARKPYIGELLKETGFNPFASQEDRFPAFEKIPEAEAEFPGPNP